MSNLEMNKMLNNRRIHPCTLLLCIAVALTSPIIAHADYLLFGATASDPKGFTLRMDDEGNLALRDVFRIGWYTSQIGVSPNGRAVVFTTSESTDSLSIIFIRSDGSLSPPVYLRSPFWYGIPVAFHKTLPLFYAGAEFITYIYSYNTAQERVAWTGLALDSVFSEHYAYSSHANALIGQTIVHSGADGVRAMRLNADGTFGEVLPPLELPRHYGVDFTLSPNGRWAVGTAMSNPKLFVAAVDRNSSLTLVETKEYTDSDVANWKYVVFSPNSRRLYLLSNGVSTSARNLICYAVDQQTGKLSELSSLKYSDFGDTKIVIAIHLTLTPDGRYAAFRSINTKVYGHNLIHVVRLYEDGRMEYLADKTVEINQYVGPLAFTMLHPQNAAGRGWTAYP